MRMTKRFLNSLNSYVTKKWVGRGTTPSPPPPIHTHTDIFLLPFAGCWLDMSRKTVLFDCRPFVFFFLFSFYPLGISEWVLGAFLWLFACDELLTTVLFKLKLVAGEKLENFKQPCTRLSNAFIWLAVVVVASIFIVLVLVRSRALGHSCFEY